MRNESKREYEKNYQEKIEPKLAHDNCDGQSC
jgi:hypothetical protein